MAEADDHSGTTVGHLDMADSVDVKALDRAIVNEWGVTPPQLRRYLKSLDVALGLSIKANNARQINQIVKTMTSIVKQIQDQEHFEQRMGDRGGEDGGFDLPAHMKAAADRYIEEADSVDDDNES